MALGGRQWAPCYSSSSSSTLSPLAPPFTVDRKPYDYAYDQAPNRDWRPLCSDLVQAEPFYPHYGSGVGRGGAPWNGPFDEGSGGVGKPSSLSPSPWMGRAEMEDSPWIGPVASAAPQQGVFADGSPVENIWCSNHVGPYARKHFESDCQGWLKDKTSLHTKDSVLNSVHSSGSGFSPLELANDAFPYSSSQVASRVVRDTLNSTSHRYFGPTMQDGSWRDEEGVLGPAAVYCPPANISDKDPKVEKSLIGQVEKSALGRRHVSINIRVPSKNSNAEAVDTGAKSNKKGENIGNAGAISLHLDKKHPSAGHGIWSEESQEKLYAKSGLTNICSGASGSTEPGIPNKNSEAIDQHNLAEDSPCWKGALASRQSPFHSVSTFVANSLTVDKKIEDAVVEVLEGSDVINSKLESLSGPSERKKEVSYLDNIGSGSQIEGCVDALLTKREISSSVAHCVSENDIVSSKPVSKSAILKASCCYSSSHVYSSSWDSYPKGASHIVKPIGPPKSSHHNTSIKPLTGHFLFRTLYDLSAFCFNYSGSDVVLTESDYELLLMTRYNIEACLSKWNIVGDKKECEHDPDQVEVLPKEGENSLCQVNNGGTPEMPEKMHPIHSGTCVESGGFSLPISSFNFTENDVMKDFEKSLSTKFNVEVDDSEASLYKKLWIEAEAALCKMKYELHSARAKMEHQSVQEKDVQGVDMQDKSGSEVKPEIKTSLPPITSKVVLEKENDLKSVQIEARSRNDVNVMAEPSSPKPEKVVASGVINTKEEVDPSVMARLRVLVARGNQVTSSNIDPQVKLQQSVAADPCIGLRQNSSKTSCSDDEFNVGACFQASPARPAIGASPWVSNIGVAEARNVETATGSGDSRLIASFDRHVPLYEVDGHGGAARLQKGLGSRMVIESYVPNNMWQGNRIQDGKQGSSSSDWEHVLQEDLAW